MKYCYNEGEGLTKATFELNGSNKTMCLIIYSFIYFFVYMMDKKQSLGRYFLPVSSEYPMRCKYLADQFKV